MEVDYPEEWRILIYQGNTYENFMISNYGRLKNVSTKRILKLNPVANGYLSACVSLGSRSKTKLFRIHKGVAETFIDNPNNLPCVNHKDCKKINNYIDNLEWCTYQYNSQHASDNNRLIIYHGIDNCNAKLSDEDVLYMRKVYTPRDRNYGARALSRKFGVCHTIVEDIVNNLTWKHLLQENN